MKKPTKIQFIQTVQMTLAPSVFFRSQEKVLIPAKTITHQEGEVVQFKSKKKAKEFALAWNCMMPNSCKVI